MPKKTVGRVRPTLTILLLVAFVFGVIVSKDLRNPAVAEPFQPTVGQRPDIVVIMTDDQRAGSEQGMPFVKQFFDNISSTTYPNTQPSTNLCCPARAALLTGKHSSATNVWDNGGSFGGWEALKRYENDLLPVWLHGAPGYRTGLFGKLVNEFPGTDGDKYTPPGWDQFNVFESSKGGAGYNSNIRGLGAGTYTTDALGKATSKFVEDTPDDQPLFAYFTPFAPHAPYKAGPYRGTASWETVQTMKRAGQYQNPSYDKVTTVQPKWMQQLPPTKIVKTEHIVRKQADTLMGVDANVERIVAAVAEHRNIDNTLFVFIGDNGYAWGDHRFVGKRQPHTLVNEVPLMVRYPTWMRVPTPGTDLRLATTVDVTATILQVAGLEPKPTLSGISLTAGVERETIPLEAAATLLKGKGLRTQQRPAYCGVRDTRYTYVKYATGEVEFYDLETDPFQIVNLTGIPQFANVEERLQKQVDAGSCDLNFLTTIVEPELPTTVGEDDIFETKVSRKMRTQLVNENRSKKHATSKGQTP